MKKTKLVSAVGGEVNLSDFITQNLHLLPVPSVPEISLYTAHPASRVGKLGNKDIHGDDHPPYWAYRWAGGTVLARHILDHPEVVAGWRVLDLGSGSGIVGIAAAKAGAKAVVSVDIDPNASIANRLNAAVNGVHITTICQDILNNAPPETDIIAIGDLFYDPNLAGKVTAYLDKCIAARITVIVGDPGREYLPRERLRVLSKHSVPDFGDGEASSPDASAVYLFRSKP
ncbi:50S ribosomal protein L11 methyltransferase [Phyllobacterium sp. SB3]|uniref:class I SAM-dependent methyltransferase n=1 Tax=Phyllobacterium sp. SB3 TaxID=3156073 RepID=UPI0032AEF2CA